MDSILSFLDKEFVGVKPDGFCWNHSALACLYDDKSKHVKKDDTIYSLQKDILPMRNKTGEMLKQHPEWKTQECMTDAEWKYEIRNLVGKLPANGVARYAGFAILRALCVAYERNGIILVEDERDVREHVLPEDYVAFLSCDPNKSTYHTYDASGIWLNCYDTYKSADFIRDFSNDKQESCLVFIFNGIDHFDTALPRTKKDLFANARKRRKGVEITESIQL